MNIFKDFIKTSKTHEYILGVLFLLYIFFNIQTPVDLAPVVNNLLFKIILVLAIISMFFYVNPIIGVLAIIAGLVFFNRSRVLGPDAIPNENVKSTLLKTFNAPLGAAKTLEEDMVNKMAPLVRSSRVADPSSVHPILSSSHNASALEDSN